MSSRQVSARELDIIVADDSRVQRWMLHELLTSAGHRIRLASDGNEALRLATESPPDLMITDLEMPGGDGFDMIEALRSSEDQRLRKIPVIVCSSRGETFSLNRALDIGVESFVTKPLRHSELAIAISNLQTTNFDGR